MISYKYNSLFLGVGNTLEWFDFGLFILLAPVIGRHFFPVNDPFTATMAAFGVFAGGFLCRPLGGVLFGYWGDTRGRSGVLKISILLITFTTLATGLLPTYQQMGVMSAVLFALMRVLQGLSVGGEYAGVIVYLTESSPAKHRGFITSFAATGANLGFLLASLVVAALNALQSAASFEAWGWRLPFLAMGLVGGLFFYYRLRLKETQVYAHLSATQQLVRHPLLTAIRLARIPLLKILGLTCISATFYYTFFGYMPHYLERYAGVPLAMGLKIQSGLLVLMLLTVPLSGWLGDKLGRKFLLIVMTLSILCVAYPCFYFLQSKALPVVIACLSVMALISILDQGNSLTTVVENCPADVRYTGVAFAYNLGMTVFGGTAPLVMSFLTEKFNATAPAYYLICMALLSLIALCGMSTNQVSLLATAKVRN